MEEQLRKELIMAAARVLGENAANRFQMADRKVEKTTLDNQSGLLYLFNDITVL